MKLCCNVFSVLILWISVNGELRIIRSCGYVGEVEDSKTPLKCNRQLLSNSNEIFYCVCSDNLCNSADSFNLSNNSLIKLLYATGFSVLVKLNFKKIE
jgi:hypothetical protein